MAPVDVIALILSRPLRQQGRLLACGVYGNVSILNAPHDVRRLWVVGGCSPYDSMPHCPLFDYMFSHVFVPFSSFGFASLASTRQTFSRSH